MRCPVVHGDPEKVGPLACGVCDGRGWLTSDDVRTLIAELDEARRRLLTCGEEWQREAERRGDERDALEARLNEARRARDEARARLDYLASKPTTQAFADLEARLDKAREALRQIANINTFAFDAPEDIAARALAAISDNPSEATEGGA